MAQAENDDEIAAVVEEQDTLWSAIDAAPPQTPWQWEAEVGEALKRTREAAGWSQQFAVEKLLEVWGIEMHQTTLAKLEAGKRPIRLGDLFALATTYGLNVSTILARVAFTAMPGESELDERYANSHRELSEAKRHAEEFLSVTISHLASIEAETQAMASVLHARAARRARNAKDEPRVEHQEAP